MSDLNGKTMGRYRVLERLGRGGMAEVYKGYQPSLDRFVAIKVLHPFLLDEEASRERFRREAHAVAALRHPNIVQVFDFDEQDDTYFMVMEYIKSPNLKAVLQEYKSRSSYLPLPRVAEIIADVANALEYAHGQGMIHRDVKPHNIMFAEDGRALLTDFGIAKIVSGVNTSISGGMSGTPAYMSPEQGRGERIDSRSDIYSLGVVLYEMLTGNVPFDADTPFATVIKHINDPLPPPRLINPDIPEPLERVVLKAMAKAPAERFQTAGELAREVNQAVQLLAKSSMGEASAPASAASSVAHSSSNAPNAPQVAAPSQPVAPRIRMSRLMMVVAAIMIVLAIPAVWGMTTWLSERDSQAATLTTAVSVTTTAVPNQTDQLLATGKYSEALALLDADLRRNPLDAETLVGRGHALVGLERYEEAVDSFTSALAVDGEQTVALLGRAEAHAGMQQWSSVLEDAGKALEADHSSLAALLLRARANAAMNQHEAALADYDTARQLHDDNVEVYHARADYFLSQNKIAEAVAELQRAVELDDTSVASWLALGNAYVAYGEGYDPQPDEAINAFTRALLLDPTNTQAYVDRGRVYLNYKGNSELARADISKAIELGPATAEMFYLRSYTAPDEPSKLPDLDQAIATEPQNDEPYTWRADYFLYHRQYQKAVADLTQAIELEPEDWTHYGMRGRVYVLQGDTERASQDARTIIEQRPDWDEGYIVLALAHVEQGAFDAAIRELDRAVDAEERWTPEEALALRGRAYLALDQPEKAQQDIAAIAKDRLDHPQVQLARAELAFDRGATDEALSILDRWRDHASMYGWGYVLRAKVMLAQGKPNQARTELNEARMRIMLPSEIKAADELEQAIQDG